MPFVFKDGSVAGTCTVCGDPSWSIRSNKCEAHKSAKPYVSKSKKAKAERTAKRPVKPALSSDGGPSESTVAQAVQNATTITASTFSSKPPSAGEWEDALAALVVLATMTYVEYVVVRPYKLPDDAATNAVSILGMSDDEARTIVGPCSYLLSKSDVNKKHGREAIEVLAFAPAILAIVAWADRVAQFRREMNVQLGGGSDVSTQSFAAPTGEGSTGGGAPIANFRGVTDPSEAPTARVNGNGPHVDHSNGRIEA